MADANDIEHLIAGGLYDLGRLLGELQVASRDFRYTNGVCFPYAATFLMQQMHLNSDRDLT